MADEKRNRAENEDLNKSRESDLDEMGTPAATMEERADLGWLYKAD